MNPTTTIDKFKLALPLSLANKIAAHLQKVNIQLINLSEASIAKSACNLTRLNDFGDPSFREAGKIVLQTAEQEANLSFTGRVSYRQEILRLYKNRLNNIDLLKNNPSILEEPIQQPLFIVSFPRTGTTLLHNLLAQDNQAQITKLWQLLSPIPPNASDKVKRKKITEAKIFVNTAYYASSEWKSITAMEAEEVEECIFLLPYNYNYIVIGDAPSYKSWYLQRDSTSDYQYYKHQLQILQWQQPDKHWLLKSPCHLWKLNALLNVFPDASIIQTHRHPKEMLGSWCSLVACIRKLHSDKVDLHKIGIEWLEFMRSGIDLAMKVRDENPLNFYDVHYEELITNPIRTVNKLYDQIGKQFNKDIETNMRKWLNHNPQHKHGVHRYDLKQFGLTNEMIENEFKEYIERFQLDTRNIPA